MAIGQQSGFKISERGNSSTGYTIPRLREASGIEKKGISPKKADSSLPETKGAEQKWDHQEKSEHKDKSTSSYLSHDKEITLKIKPRKLVEASVLILMFVAVFYL